MRNEPLDLWVYGYAAACYLGMPRWKEHDWDRLAARIEPPLFEPKQDTDGSTPVENAEASAEATAAAASAAAAPTAAVEPKRGGIKRVGRVGGSKFRP